MPLLTILTFPDPRLRRKAVPVTEVNAEVRQLVDNMFETLYKHQGVGLAAIQVGVASRIIVLNVSGDQQQGLCLINPEILSKEGSETDFEGCLSYPSVFEKIERAAKIRFKALDQQGHAYEMEASGLLARCVQHETEHLDGLLFIDHLSRLKQERARKKLNKYQRQAYS